MARKIPIKKGTDFVGERVIVAYNLNRCHVGSPAKPGEACFTVRDKPGGRVRAYVRTISLEDVRPRILPASLKRIQRTGLREVCCYLEGTVVGPSAVRGRLVRARFNPFRSPCFHTAGSTRCWTRASYAVFKDRTMQVVAPEYGRAKNGPFDDLDALRAELAEAGAADYAAAIDEYTQNPSYRSLWPSERDYARDLAGGAARHLNGDCECGPKKAVPISNELYDALRATVAAPHPNPVDWSDPTGNLVGVLRKTPRGPWHTVLNLDPIGQAGLQLATR